MLRFVLPIHLMPGRPRNPGLRAISHSPSLCAFGILFAVTALPTLCGQSNSEHVDPSSNAGFELALKQALPPSLMQSVAYSPNEHYAALADAKQIVIYDLILAQEVRRITIARVGLGLDSANFAFSHKGNRLYVHSGPSLEECNLEDSSDCKTLQSDLGSTFILSDDDLVAYVTRSDIPVVLDPKQNRVVRSLPNTIPQTDEEDFSWSRLAFYQVVGHPMKLALAGEIDREVPTANPRHGTETRTIEEWHTSVFDLRRGEADIKYSQLPLSVDNSAFSLRGDLLLCGTASKDVASDDPPSSVYSISTRSFLTSAELKEHVPEEINKCLGRGPFSTLLGFSGSPSNSPPEMAYKFGAMSPRKDKVLYSQNTSEFQTLLYEGYPGTRKPPQVLAGSFSSTSSVEFVPNRPVIITRGLSTDYWDLSNGRVTSYQNDGHLSTDFKITAAFRYHFDNQKVNGADLWLQDNVTGTQTQTSLHLPQMPDWYAVSAHGDSVAYKVRGKLHLYVNGATTDVPCNPPINERRKPSLDSTGTILSAVCDRDADDHSQTGSTAFLIRWQLPSLAEMELVSAEGFRKCASLGPDGTTALLCDDRQLRVINLNTKAVTNISVPKPATLDERWLNIADGQLQKDNQTIVLAMAGLNSGKVEWINSADNSLKSSTTLNGINSFATDGFGDAAVLSPDGVVSVFDRTGAWRMRLVPVGLQDWLVFSNSGFFDGTPNAIKWASYRSSTSSPPVPVDTLFNELYTPGLLQLLFMGQSPRLPDGISLSTILELPGTQSLLQTAATPALLDGKAVVCFDRTDVFQALRGRFGQSPILVGDDDTHPDCSNRVVLSDQSNPQATLKALQAIKSERISSPWDHLQIASQGIVHLLTIAVGEYAHMKDLQPIPTAVPAMERLEALLKARYAGEHLIDWDEQCGGGLHDAAATKRAILMCLDKMMLKVGPDDMVILIFAGHGGTVATEAGESELFYFYPADVTTTADGLENAISSAELADKLRYLAARREVIVMDACDSGALMPPLEGAAAAKMREALAFTNPSPGTSSTLPNSQGVLLVAAAAEVEDAVGGTNANPFLDRLLDVLTPKSSQSVFARDIASMMSAPLVLEQQNGPPITTTPVAIQIGADFAVTKP